MRKAIICGNQAELSYMNEWLKINNITEAWLGERDKFPICITTDGCWLDRLDRAIDYISFKDFITAHNKVDSVCACSVCEGAIAGDRFKYCQVCGRKLEQD